MEVRLRDSRDVQAVLGHEVLDAIDIALRIHDEGIAAVVDDVAAVAKPRGIEGDDVRDAGCGHVGSLLVMMRRDYTPGGIPRKASAAARAMRTAASGVGWRLSLV